MAEDNKKCGHEMCDCGVTDGELYCGDHCQKAAEQDIVEITCDCGHPECGHI